MSSKEILSFCVEKGFLLDKDILNLFCESSDIESAKLVLEKIGTCAQQRIITKNIFSQNAEQVSHFFQSLSTEKQKRLEKLKIKLGLTIKILQKREIYSSTSNSGKDNGNISGNPAYEQKEESQKNNEVSVNSEGNVKGVSMNPLLHKKLEVKDFVEYFRNRLTNMQNILQGHSKMKNLVSINKISERNQNVSIIGIVSDKKATKNKNILLEVEDLTGKTKVLVNCNKPELYEKAEEIALDSVLGFNGSGNREILFANDIIFPESYIQERKNSFIEEYALFIGDLHFGSKRFLESNFLKFIDYLNGKVPNTPEVTKIKYLFIVGDIVTGVGNYPNQEKDLVIRDLEEQFSKLAGLLGKIRKDIKIIISPGNHDGVQLMEPQPMIDEKFAWALYDLKNVVLTSNPASINIGAKKDFSGFDILTYHGFSFPFYANNIPQLVKKRAMNVPEEIMKYLLKNRHLAPSHTSVQYFPSEEDALMITKVPDLFVAAHTHKSAVSYYNNILVISVSSWESFTPYQEKFGNKPDYCKVPMFNLKTRAIKILDFEDKEIV